MSALRQAAYDYIEMRRGLGFKLRKAGKGLIDFVSFLEANDAPYITMELALEWAQRPSHAQPSHWAARLGYIRGFARHRVATDPRTQIPPDGLLPFRPKRGRDRILIHRTTSGVFCPPRLRCRADIPAASSGR